jgi:hypothetical protein
VTGAAGTDRPTVVVEFHIVIQRHIQNAVAAITFNGYFFLVLLFKSKGDFHLITHFAANLITIQWVLAH